MQASSRSNIMHAVVGERQIFITTALAKRPERRLALTVVVLSFAIFIGTIPFARLPLPQVWAFMPIYESALIISDLITAILLFAQYDLLRTRSLLVLASGYLFTAAMIVPHALTFPGLFAPAGLLGAGPQSTAWLYMFWHGGFPLVVIVYALLKGAERDPSSRAG
jgi:two-component system sensor histidine kinase UhpB